ncbi:MAG: hypothetical protein ACLUR5_15535 [Eubacterium ventriosum]
MMLLAKGAHAGNLIKAVAITCWRWRRRHVQIWHRQVERILLGIDELLKKAQNVLEGQLNNTDNQKVIINVSLTKVSVKHVDDIEIYVIIF